MVETQPTPRGPYSFRPDERVRSSGEYQRVKREGRRGRSPHFGVNFAPNGLQHHRLGMVVLKRYWCAVDRNRVKRCLREWFRLHKNQISLPGKDVVIIARPGAEKLSSTQVARELLAVFKKEDGRSL